MEKKLQEISKLLEQEIQFLELPEFPKNLYEPIRYFLKLGGKRIRPILTILGTELFGKSISDSIHAALAIEYFHNFSLIHDDIMDKAPLRRAQKTIHKKWNSNIAILSGDVLLIKAYQKLSKQNPEHLSKLMETFNQTAIEICEGQQMDMDFESKKNVSVPEYIEMIRLKTAVLLACALKLGAIISDASDDNQKALYVFGENIGLAFQIQDDLLDLYANAATFGKQIGGDIISNKKTILLLKALELANPMQKEFLSNLTQIKNPRFKIEQTISIFNEIGVKEEVLNIRNYYFEKGIEALNSIQIPVKNKKNLINLVDFLKEREI